MPAVVKQFDHIVVRADDPRPLFDLLTGAFGLPVAWPMRSYPSFTSGGVALGNLYLEIISCAARRASSTDSSPEASFAAIAYEADLIAEAVKELDRRGIPHGPITPYVEAGADGKKQKLYSNAILGKMLGRSFWIDTMILMGRLPGASSMANPGAGGALVRWGIDKVMRGNLVFLVEYAYENFTDLPHWSEFKDHAEKCAADRAALASGRGGALGLEEVKEVVAGVSDLGEAQSRWRKFLGPSAETAPGLWTVANGPAVRLVRAAENAIQSLVLTVASLEKAETVLSEKGMLGARRDGMLAIAPEKLFGLDVRLAE